MKKSKSNPKSLLVIAAIVLFVTLVLGTLNSVISAPTSAHRDAARQLDSFSRQGDTPAGAYERLYNSSEVQYTVQVGFFIAAIEFLTYIALVVLAYRYVRLHKIVTNPGGKIVALFTVVGIISTIYAALFTAWYFGTPIPSSAEFIGITIGAAVASFVVSFLIVFIAERIYDRKNSFVID
mgnify:CR=1 FL=1